MTSVKIDRLHPHANCELFRPKVKRQHTHLFRLVMNRIIPFPYGIRKRSIAWKAFRFDPRDSWRSARSFEKMVLRSACYPPLSGLMASKEVMLAEVAESMRNHRSRS